MPISPGELYEPRAVDLNDLDSMLNEWRAGRLRFESTPLVSLGQSSIVKVKCPSSAGVTPGDVLGLGDPVISPTDDVNEFRSNFTFTGAVPSTSTPHYGQYGIVQDAADADGFCRCVVSGVTFVKLNITHASDKACEIANSVSTYLTTGYVGTSRILWKSSGTGSTDKWGLIRVGDTLDNFVGKADGAISSGGGTGTVSVWDPAFAGDLGMNVTGCYNHSGTALALNDKVSGCVIAGVPVIAKIC